MPSRLALICEGHLLRVYHIFAYLKRHHNAETVFDPTEPVIDLSLFEQKDWRTSEMTRSLEEVTLKDLANQEDLGSPSKPLWMWTMQQTQ